jgi:hypothetical protein
MNLSTAGRSLFADSAIDLHIHTNYSDGRWTPELLIDHLLDEQFHCTIACWSALAPIRTNLRNRPKNNRLDYAGTFWSVQAYR